MGAKVPLTRCYALQASLRLRQGDRAGALELARKAFGLASAENYLQMFITFYGLYREAVSLALEEGVETAFVQEILSRLGEQALPALSEFAAHTDPTVRKRVIRPLVRIGSGAADELLRKLLRDPDEGVSEEALAAMRAKEPRVQPSIQVRSAEVETPKMAPFRASCLGPFRVFVLDQSRESEVEVQWRTSKARDILAYLLHRGGGPVARERLLEDLWPEVDEEQSSTLFHTSLYQLRKVLREAGDSSDAITYAGGYYRLDRDLVSTDAAQLDTLLKASQSGGLAHNEEAVLERIVALYEGDYLENLDYPWVLAERERLAVIFADFAGRLGRKYLEAREFARASSLLRLLLQRNPLLEEVHCLLMRAYAGMGDRLAVMQQYETLKEALDNELGVDPSPETRRLYYELCGEKK
jgi:two-component SAPR family response regulator